MALVARTTRAGLANMANLDFSITDPSSDWYSPAYQSAMHEGGFEHAAKEGRTDEIGQYNRYRKINMGIPNDPTSAYQIHYSTKVPPWFFGKLTDQLYGSSDTNILPLNSARDPNYAYSQFARNEMLANDVEQNWKMLANMPDSPNASEATRNAIRRGIEELGNKFHRYSNAAEGFKIESIELQDAYNRQIGINNLRTHDAAANADAEIVEQDSRDFAMIDRGIGSGRLPPTAENLALRETARLRLEGSMGNWDADLKGRGFAGPKGPYLLSGFPGQFLDDIADNAARDLKIKSDQIKMFQSKYVNDAPFRASVNQSLKSKVPGVLAAGLGGVMVKQKMDEGDSLPQAVAGTAADIVLGAAKFALYERFVGAVEELGAPERDPNEVIRQRSPDRMTPFERQRKNSNDAFQEKMKSMTPSDWDRKREVEDIMSGRSSNKPLVDAISKAQMAELEVDFPGIRKEEDRVAKILRERMKKSKEVEMNVTNSPFWNNSK